MFDLSLPLLMASFSISNISDVFIMIIMILTSKRVNG